MGMFDFVSKVGAKLGIDYFEKQEELKKVASEQDRAAQDQALRDQVAQQLLAQARLIHLPIENFSVVVAPGGVVSLSGTAASQEAKEKAVVFVGNHQGITKVNDDGIAVVKPEPPGVLHRVQKGDTLSLIAKKYYGVIMAYPAIADANKDLVKNVDQIEIDWVIRVPPLEAWKYTTKAGDTLGAIAKTMYGDLKLYPKIFEASKDVMTNPDVVKPGMVLTVPVLQPLPAVSNVVS